MANTSPSRLGQVNGSGDVDSLFLKVFSGEILTTFEEQNIMKDLHMVRTISSGKTAQFPVTGVAEAKYHTVGEDIVDSSNSYLSNIKHAERTINIDDVLIASTFIANIDELKNHYDVRSIYAKELGKALAKRFDIATMKTLFAAAGGSSEIGGNGGTSVSGATTTTAAGLVDSLYAVARSLDEKDAPEEGRFAVLTPSQYYTLLTADNVAINRDTGGVGDVSTGKIAQVAGISLFKSNHLDSIIAGGDDSAVATGDGASNNDVFGAGGTGYNGDFSALSGTASAKGFLAGTKEAIGTVKLLDLATESEYQIQRQGTLFVAKYAMGHAPLRPECAVKVLPA
jgi:hypothetical protein